MQTRPLILVGLLALVPLTPLSAGADVPCDAGTVTFTLPCPVSGEPVPRDDVRCALDAFPQAAPVDCVFDPVEPSGLLAGGINTGMPVASGDSEPAGCRPYVDVHGPWSHHSSYGPYVTGYPPGTSYFELHHTCPGKTWSQSLHHVTVTSGAAAAYRSHNQVNVWWGDLKYHNTCVTFRLSDGSTPGTCAMMYN